MRIEITIGGVRYYARQTLMALSGRSRRAVECWANRGQLKPCRHLGNLALYDVEDAERFLDRLRSGERLSA